MTASRTAQVVRRHEAVQFDARAQLPQPRAEIAQRFREFLLAGYPPREIELAADLARRLEQRDIVAARCGCRRAREACRSCADHGDLEPPGRRLDFKFGLAVANGLTSFVATRREIRSRHAWLRPMHC